jgi:alanyl-tRNA synthetase
MTDRLYYTDAYLTEFEACLVSSIERDGRRLAVLDRTAFYPTSGGQPFDTGTLDGARVVEVLDGEDGTVEHVLEGSLGTNLLARLSPPTQSTSHAPSPLVRGRIDWDRRFDHMQQHTGQHVLSAAFDRLHGARTMSFHLGREASTIDLSLDLAPSAVAAAEDGANRIIWENRPVAISFATPEQAASLAFRKEPVRGGLLRIVEVEGFDISACGGTHVNRTGSVGAIVVTGAEKFRGGTRVTFACGGRAVSAYRLLRAATDGSVRLLSVLPAELPAAIARLQADSKESRRQIRELGDRVAGHQADELIACAPVTSGGVRAIVDSMDGSAERLKALAAALTSKSSVVVALVSASSPHLIVVARSQDVAFDAGACLRELIARFGGKGGGRAEMAQAGGLEGPAAAIVEAARTSIASKLSS